MDTVPDEVTYG